MRNLLTMAGLEATTQTAETTNPMADMNSFMSLFMIVIGAFIMYSAITGTGPAYKNDYPKAIKADHAKMLRKFCWIVGPVALASGILDYMGYTIAYWISMGIILPAIVIYVIIFRRKFKKYL